MATSTVGRARSLLETWKNYCTKPHSNLMLWKYNVPSYASKTSRMLATAANSAKDVDFGLEDDEFRVLVIPGYTKIPEKAKVVPHKRKEIPPARYKGMPTDQDWTSVWPSASTFKWSVVPFPVRQGIAEGEENDGIPPGKYANAELMKIPNFLHLTPVHIKQQCAAIKKFCTPWPEGLDTDAQFDKHFPVEVTSRTYITDSPSLRDARARVITLKLKISALDLDYHAKDKLLRLIGDRYDPKTELVTLTTDRCPMRQQNYDYALYLLTALYHESLKTEPWESEKTVADMEKYVWELNPSKVSILTTVRLMKTLQNASSSEMTGVLKELPAGDVDDDVITSLDAVRDYSDAVTCIHNDGETVESLEQYKAAVKALLLGAA